MKLDRLILQNFRSHQRLDLTFEPNVTVLVGDNGEGKTSVLDAISQVFGRFLSKLPGIKGIALSEADLRIVSNNRSAPGFRAWLELNIEAEAKYLSGVDDRITPTLYASRSRLRDGSAKTRFLFHKDAPIPVPGRGAFKEIDRFADAIVAAELDELDYRMPLIAYYGTDRAVFETPLRRRNFRTQFARFDCFDGALNANANFKRVFEWFHAKETEEVLTQREMQSFAYRDPELNAVRHAIENFFEDFTNPRTTVRPLRFVVDKKESSKKTITFDLNQLSDGYRTTLAMVADLACRMVEANPPSVMKNPLEAEAIVLIDEVDLHLHPRWQQKIVPDLLKVFPNTQFIVTTHSPQVLTTVEARSIRKLIPAGSVTEVQVPNFSLGAQSVQLLEDIQEVDARPQIPIIESFRRYRSLVESDQWDSPEALKLRAELDEWAANKEPELKRIDIDIKMRKFRRGKK